MANKTSSVPAIHCQHCVRTIERELSELDGVTSVKADLDSQQVTVTWQEEQTNWDSIRALLEEIGYPAES
jgi:copper chaperone